MLHVNWCRAVDLGDYSAKLSAGYTVIALVAAFLAQSLYRDFFESVLKLSLSEEYSYILASLFTVLVVIYLSIKYVGFSYSIRVSKVLASASLTTLAVLTYLLSRFTPEYYVHLQGLSFALLFASTMVVVYDPVSPAHIIPMLTVFLLMPLPASVVDPVTLALSRVVGRLAAVVTGSKLLETPGYAMLEIGTPSGARSLSVEAACSGVVALGSVVAATPIIVLLALMGRARVGRKVLSLLAAIASALAIGFLGNLVRVLIVVYAARSTDIETAMNLLHYSPSVIYSSISALVAFLVVSKYSGLETVYAAKRRDAKNLDVSWSYILGVLALALAMVSAVSLAIPATESTLTPGGSSGLSIAVRDFESLLENPATYLSTKEVTYLSALREGYLARVLGALAVYRVSIEFSGDIYRGYVEFVDTPAKLHTWQLCLTVQGYRVTRSWSKSYGALQVGYIVAEMDEEKYLLTYALIPVIAKSEASDHKLFARISAFTPFEDLAEVVEDSTKLVLAIASRSTEKAELKTEAVSVLYVASYTLLALLATYLLLISLRHVFHRARPKGQ